MLKNPWAQAVLSLLASVGCFVLAVYYPTAAERINMTGMALFGFAVGRPISAGNAPLGPSERNPEIPPPAGDK